MKQKNTRYDVPYTLAARLIVAGERFLPRFGVGRVSCCIQFEHDIVLMMTKTTLTAKNRHARSQDSHAALLDVLSNRGPDLTDQESQDSVYIQGDDPGTWPVGTDFESGLFI